MTPQMIELRLGDVVRGGENDYIVSDIQNGKATLLPMKKQLIRDDSGEVIDMARILKVSLWSNVILVSRKGESGLNAFLARNDRPSVETNKTRSIGERMKSKKENVSYAGRSALVKKLKADGKTERQMLEIVCDKFPGSSRGNVLKVWSKPLKKAKAETKPAKKAAKSKPAKKKSPAKKVEEVSSDTQPARPTENKTPAAE